MSSKRKTFDVQELKEKINQQNRTSTCAPETRDGWNSVLESILMASGQYKGFRYLEKSEVPDRQLPGIVWGNLGANTFPDETRRQYI